MNPFFFIFYFPEMQIIERGLPKKPKIIKDPSIIEREEMEKIGKVWVNIVRRDIPKHHRIFTTLHRKQLIDAKRFSENCQREARTCHMAYAVFPCIFLYLWMISLFPLCSSRLVCFSNNSFMFQVKMKVSRSLKIMKGAAIRTRKLARDMLLFWKRVDKEMVLSVSLLNFCSVFISI
jgi:DNA helicase INO80